MCRRNLFPPLVFALVSLGCHKLPPPPAELTIPVVMKQWEILPHEIRVRKGTLVHLHVTTADVQHGFDVRGLNISEPVNPGRPTDISFRADMPGRYTVECDILCGKGHDDMEATIIIEQ